MRNMLRFLPWPVITLLACSSSLLAQQMEVINENPYTPDLLIQNVFLGEGIEILSIDYQGDPLATGYFRDGMDAIGLERGLLLTTGEAADEDGDPVVANGGNASSSINNASPLSDDPDLRTVLGNSTSLNDITVYTITFQPLTDSVSFRYVFASEEYPEYVCSNFNDVFGFFISGPGINGPYSNGGINLARIPGTDLPVRINNVNGGAVGSNGSANNCTPPAGSLNYSEFYNNNNGQTTQSVFDGYTDVFTAATRVEACGTYTIKLIIADVSDSSLDSGVFLEARSFSGESTNLEIVNLAIDGGMAEGCRPIDLHFYTTRPVEEDFDLSVNFFGEATPGVDYTQPPAQFTIPAGDSLLVVPLEAFEDNLPDAGESIFISLQRSFCFLDTFQIRIEESPLNEILLSDDVTVCPGDAVSLDVEVPGAGPQLTTFTSDEVLDIPYTLFGTDWASSTIEVSGVIPEILSAQVLESVCITELEHGRPGQIDAYLFGPTGTPVELTTDNGGNGGGAPFEGYLNTCFTPASTNPITGPGNQAPNTFVPFTGEWEPEGPLDELWFGGDQPSNGTWELRVKDDFFTVNNGELRGWSVTFRRDYDVEYAWDPAADLSCYDCPNPTLTANEEGFVNVTVSDIYGCTITDSVEVEFENNQPLSVLPDCSVTTDSTISFSWGGASSAIGYEVQDPDGNWVSVGLATDFVATDLIADSLYTFFVRTVFANCPGPAFPVSCRTIDCSLDAPLVSGQATPTLCADTEDGTISLSGMGGIGPLRYQLGEEENDSGQFTDLAAGNYLGFVIDERECRYPVPLNIDAPQLLEASIDSSGLIGCNTSVNLDLSFSGGTAGYDFSWNGQTTDEAFLLGVTTPGQYIVEIIDANGCRASDTILITAPEVLSFDVGTTDAACLNVPNGSISITPGGGVGPYTYGWAGGVAGDTSTANNLAAGTYEVSITDFTGCTASQSVVVESGPEVVGSWTSEVANCYAEASGSASVSAQNGVGPYTFNWADPGLAGPNVVNLLAGTYEMTITDQRGCQTPQSVVVEQPDSVQLLSLATTDPSCAGTQDGSITVLAGGGNGGFSYAWNNGASGTTLSQIPAETYVLTVTDANGCTLVRALTLNDAPPLEVRTQVTDNLCPGGTAGVVVASSPATSLVTYFWPELNASGSTQNGLAAGTYTLVATDANDCPSELTVTINEPPPLLVESVAEDAFCHGEETGLLELSASGGTPGYQYRLAGQDWGPNGTFLGLAPGNYEAEIRDLNNCSVSLGELVIGEPDPFTIDLGERRSVRYGDSLQLLVNASGGVLPITRYAWTSGNDSLLSCRDCPAPWAKPLDQTTVYLRAFDQSGCPADALLNILVEKDFPVRVPTGFTPNMDGNNDLLVVHGMPGVTIARFQVFDRWGELVYENFDFPVNESLIGWDGTHRGEELNGGAFVWQLEAILPDGSRERYHGQTALIR